jgi:hypothetical protein
VLCGASLVALAQGLISPGQGGTGGVQLQATSPGTMQTGNINLSGTLCVGCASATTGLRTKTLASGIGAVKFSYPGPLTGGNSAYEIQASNPAPAPFNRVANFTMSGGTVAWFGLGSATSIGHLGIQGTGGAEVMSASGNTSLTLAGSPSAATPNVIIDTQGGTTTGPLLDVRSIGVSKASFSPTGLLVTAVPIPLISGGTGSGAVTCAAGQFLTSNGTAYTCAAIPAASTTFAAAGYVQSVTTTPTIVNPVPATGMSVIRTGTGQYNVSMAGITAQSIVLCTAVLNSSPLGACMAQSQLGAVSFQIVNGANGGLDANFSFIIVKL